MPNLSPSTPEDLHQSSQLDAHDADLAALLADWKDETSSRSPGWLAALALCLVGLGLLVMWSTFENVSWRWQPQEPLQLGNVRELWSEGRLPLHLEDNKHVSLDAVIPSRPQAVAKAIGLSSEQRTPSSVAYVFYCPLSEVLVLSSQDLAVQKASPEHVERFKNLIDEHAIFREDLAFSLNVSGRLRLATKAPRELAPFVEQYARRLERKADSFWVLIEGATPPSAIGGTLLWAASLLPGLVALAFYGFAVRQGRRVRREEA